MACIWQSTETTIRKVNGTKVFYCWHELLHLSTFDNVRFTICLIPTICCFRSKVLQSIERLLNLAYHYIVTVEENYVLSRSFPPHGSCFHGYPITIHVISESNKTEFDLKSHSNESFGAVRQKIATKLEASLEHIQVYKNEVLVRTYIISAESFWAVYIHYLLIF